MPAPQTNEGHWVTIPAAAEYYSVDPKTIRRMAFSGELIARRFGPRLIRIWLSHDIRLVGQPLGPFDSFDRGGDSA